MATAQKNTASVVRELIGQTVRDLGYELWDVEFVKEGTEWYLRITIDSPNGIGIDDCETVARAIDPMLDEADPIEQSYRMEVSSPGLERTLRTPEHLASCVGEQVRVFLFKALEGSKQHVGKLQGYRAEDDTVVILPDNTEEALAFPMKAISRITTVFDFDSINMNGDK